MIRSSSSADIELQTLRERGVRTAESDPPPSDYTVTACSHLRRRHKNVGDGEISLKLLCYATAIDTARRVQAVYDGTSLLVRRRTILPGGPDHAVGCCNCQTWSQICRIQYSCSATNYIVARRPVLCGGWPTCMEQTSTTASSRFFLLLLSNVNLRHFLYNHAFNSHC